MKEYILAAGLDVGITLAGLTRGYPECDPVTRRALETFGPPGIIGLFIVISGVMLALERALPARWYPVLATGRAFWATIHLWMFVRWTYLFAASIPPGAC